MESNELRTGNIINFFNGSTWLQGSIKGIGEFESIIDAWVIENKNLQGIEITEEWFPKFGFREMEDTVPEGYPTFWPPESNRFRFYYSNSDQLFHCDVFDWQAEQIIESIASFSYVHQLQNLYFALLGKEADYTPTMYI